MDTNKKTVFCDTKVLSFKKLCFLEAFCLLVCCSGVAIHSDQVKQLKQKPITKPIAKPKPKPKPVADPSAVISEALVDNQEIIQHVNGIVANALAIVLAAGNPAVQAQAGVGILSHIGSIIFGDVRSARLQEARINELARHLNSVELAELLCVALRNSTVTNSTDAQKLVKHYEELVVEPVN